MQRVKYFAPKKIHFVQYQKIFYIIKNIFFRRRSKAHAGDLHSYCVSRGGGGGQFYDDLYISGQLGAGHTTNVAVPGQFSYVVSSLHPINPATETAGALEALIIITGELCAVYVVCP